MNTKVIIITFKVLKTVRNVKKVIISIIILLFILVIVFSYLFFRESETIKNILEANETSTEFVDTSLSQKDTSIIIKKDSLLPTKQSALLYEESANEISYTYYIIAGSFSKKTNAVRFQNMLIEEGLNAKIIRSDFELYKVSVFSSTDKTIALDSLMKIKNVEKFKSAWLLNRRR